MSTEDRLRDALNARAASIEPKGDGWDRIEARLDSPRRSSTKRFVGIAAAVAALGAGLFAILQGGNGTPVVAGNPDTTTTTTAPAAVPVTAVDYAIWPSADNTTPYESPQALAENFASGWLGMTSPTVGTYREGDSRSGEIDIRSSPGGVATTLSVREDAARGWMVIDARSPSLELATPATLDAVSSPITLTGRSVAFEGVVHMTLLRRNLSLNCAFRCGALGFVGMANSTFTGHGTELTPFQTTLAFSSPQTTTGILVLWTDSPKDGSIAEATVRLVSFAP